MDTAQALEVHRVYGFSSAIVGGVVDIRTNNRDSVAYAAGNIIVIHHCPSQRQTILQGHIHQIKCVAVTPSKSVLISADCGPDATIITWDCCTQAIKAVAQNRKGGVVALDVSPDGAYFATLSDDSGHSPKQELCIWDLGISNNKPIVATNVPAKKLQTCVRFNGSDQSELITNGPKSVYFWKHKKEEKSTEVTKDSLQCRKAVLKAAELKQGVGAFTVSTFVPSTSFAITGTTDGDVVVWEQGLQERQIRTEDARAMHATKYVATGGADGYLHFYDSRLGLSGWFEELAAGEVTSLSFSSIVESEEEAAFHTLKVPPFVVGTRNAHVLLLHAGIFEEQPGSLLCKGEEVTQFMPETVQSMSAHPRLPCFASISADGLFQIHDYSSRSLVRDRKFSYLRASIVEYSPAGNVIACGFTNGILKILNADTLVDAQSFSYASSTLSKIVFSHDGTLLASSDGSCAIALLSCRHQEDERWIYIGKYRSHARPVVGLQFTVDVRGLSRLFSVAQDNMLVEYDLVLSDGEVGLNLRGTWELNSLMKPSSIFPFTDTSTGEVQVLVCDEGFKMRVYEAEKYVCNKTFLGPSFGNPVTKLLTLKDRDKGTDYVVYVTREQVLGVMTYPKPEERNLHILGVVAHAGAITSLAISHDSNYVMTAGLDSIVIVWKVSMPLLEASLIDDWNQAGPYPMLPPGAEGKVLIRSLREQFFCSQIRAQGEEFLDERNLDNTTPLSQLPDLLRSVRIYPSNSHIRDILQELALPCTRAKVETPNHVTFGDFVTLFANHRSMIEYNDALFQMAFNAVNADAATGKLPRDTFFNMLQTEGEALSREELRECVNICMGGPTDIQSFPKEINGSWFVKNLLGL